jgi:UDP-GlcNAc:undecaprenyl-phosphate GlcNAc-1-phosphate transferase
VIAMFACALLVPLMIRLSPALGLMAKPSERHRHPKPTPLLGGIALYAGFALAVLLFLPQNLTTLAVLLASGLAAVLLVADDRWSFPPLAKFGLQVAISLLAVIGFGQLGFQITFVTLPGLGLVHLGWLAIPISLFWLLGMQNTMNFLDGVDGLAAGVVAIVAITLLLAAASRPQMDVVLFCGALAGACTGFLVFNWHPAKIFMGDSGAHFLGVALGLISILGVAKIAVAFALVLPVLALALPIGDTVWAIYRRWKRGRSVAEPDAGHLHHRLQDLGFDPREICYVFYGTTAVLGAVGLMFFGHKRILGVVLVVLLAVLSTVAESRLQRSKLRLKAPFLKKLLALN